MTPRERQALFRARIKSAAWLILATVVVSLPGLMFIHWIIFGY